MTVRRSFTLVGTPCPAPAGWWAVRHKTAVHNADSRPVLTFARVRGTAADYMAAMIPADHGPGLVPAETLGFRELHYRQTADKQWASWRPKA